MQNLLYVIILLCAFPAGYLLAWLARDELVAGKKWFIALAIVSVVAIVPVIIFLGINLAIILTLLFLAIICLMAVWKSYDKKWVRK